MTATHHPGSWTWLPGTLRIARGSIADYATLQRFHYLGGRPATWADVRVARYAPPEDPSARAQLAAVAVLSWPVPCMRGRETFFGTRGWAYGRRLRWANRNVRTISRVIVHPQFRGVGLASGLVRQLIAACPVRYVEAVAAMGRAHPFFEKAGMRRIDPADEGAVYYVFDRKKPI